MGAKSTGRSSGRILRLKQSLKQQKLSEKKSSRRMAFLRTKDLIRIFDSGESRKRPHRREIGRAHSGFNSSRPTGVW